MRFKNIVLINPPYRSRVFSVPVVLPGLGHLAETIEFHTSCRVSIIDAALGLDERAILKQLKEIRPDLVGLSLISYRMLSHYRLIAAIKQAVPGVTVLAGGPHVSSIKERILTDVPELDYGIVLDGERPLLELVQATAERDIPGLIYRSSDGPTLNPPQLVADLDTIPWPKYSRFDLPKYGQGMSICTSRGCPYNCIYCSCHVIGKKFRTRSAESVGDEIEYWYKRGYREFGLQEDNPTFHKERMHQICDEILRRRLDQAVFHAGNGVRVERVDGELLDHMYRAGFRRLAFGVESAVDKVLKRMKKGQTVDQIDRAVRLACEKGFFVSLFFVLGTPGETPEDVEQSFRFALKYPIQDVSFYDLVPMPNTELWDYVETNNLWNRRPEDYLNSATFPMHSLQPVFYTPEFTTEQRIRALKRGRQIRSLVARRTIETRLSRYRRLGRWMAYLYSRNSVRSAEVLLLKTSFYQHTFGKLRTRIRAMFYAR